MFKEPFNVYSIDISVGDLEIKGLAFGCHFVYMWTLRGNEKL